MCWRVAATCCSVTVCPGLLPAVLYGAGESLVSESFKPMHGVFISARASRSKTLLQLRVCREKETLRRQQDKKKHIINIRINEVSWHQHPKSRWDGGHTCSLGGWKIRYARCHALFVDLAAVGPNGKILTQTQHLVGSDVSWEHSPAAAFPHLVLPNRDARGELLWDGGRRKKGFPPLHPSPKVGLQRGMRGETGARSILCPHATPLLPSPPSP